MFNKNQQNIKIAILSNATCDEINGYIRSGLLAENIDCSIYLSKYNQIYTDIFDKNSELYQFLPNCILLLLDEKIITEKLPTTWGIEDLKTVCEETNNQIQALMTTLNHHDNKIMLIVNTLIFSKKTINQLVDYQSKSTAMQYLSKINQSLFDRTDVQSNLVVLDLNLFLQDEGVSLQDSRLAFYAGMGFHSTLLDKISEEFIKILKARLGLSKKILILDLDNTLWGGILGDDGIENLKLGGEYEGLAYQDFQKVVKQLGAQGVLLAISSKNEIENVEKVFALHPEMYLKKNDFVNVKANWLPKYENIRCIQKNINIGMDSIVFVDDSAFECESVKKFLPEVTTIFLPEDPALFSEHLLSKGLFNKLNLTEEDINRTNSYLMENNRKAYSQKFESIESFLSGLRIYLRVFIPNIYQNERVSQLSFRTNQFNMTGIKFTSEEIKDLSQDKNWIIIGADYEDKFGKNGLIAAVFIEIIHEFNLKKFVIRNFLLSCRVFSRGVEDALMAWVIKYAKKMQIQEIIGIYISTPKNSHAKDFYFNNNFKKDPLNEHHYVLSNFNHKNSSKFSWITLISEIEEKLYAHAE